MIVATPVRGGHYLVDILAGIAVPTVAIAVPTAISATYTSSRLMVTTRLVMDPAHMAP